MALPGRRRAYTKGAFSRLAAAISLSRLKSLVLNNAPIDRLGQYRAHVLLGWAALLFGALILLLSLPNAGAIADNKGRPIADRRLAAVRTSTPEPSGLLVTATPSQDTALVQAAAPATSTPAPSAAADPSSATPLPTATSLPTMSPTLPATSTPALSTSQCGPPAGWVLYAVQSGENLFRISLRYDVSLAQMRQANCLTIDFIYAGQRIYVPYHLAPSPTEVPAATPTPTLPPPSPEPAASTPTPTATQLPPTSPPPTATAPPPSPTSPSPAATPVAPTPTPTPILVTPPATPTG